MQSVKKHNTIIEQIHLCSSCYEVGRGYYLAANEKKICKLCGGTALSLQEAADTIADLQVELQRIKEYYGHDL